RLECLKLLASQRSADLSVVDVGNNTLLHAAAGAGSLEMVSFLLEQGLSIHDINDEGLTPAVRDSTSCVCHRAP
ncbi:unnamed protein product, partial [Discosporangium mesarthrocarpum]